MTSMCAALVLLAASQAAPSFPGVLDIPVLPSQTDPAITKFDTDHVAYISTKAPARNQLVIFLPGTNGRGTGAKFFGRTAAELGYHVINLSYPTDIAATVVRNQPSREAYLHFRLEIIEGGDKSKFVDVDRTNSIENRVIKLLAHLHKTRPEENWGQYLDAQGGIQWAKIVPAGQSQGAGHAALIAYRHPVARVVITGGPKDYDRSAKKPAGWFSNPKTPINRFFNFNHVQDKQGCDYDEQIEICRVMGMDKAGEPVSVDDMPAPYNNSRILTTNFPGTPMESVAAHVSVMSDGAVPRTADGSLLFKPVWQYMLTAKLDE